MSASALFEILWKNHQHDIESLVSSLAKGKPSSDYTFRSLVAAGQVALWESSLRYKAEKIRSGSFWDFAKHRIRGAIYDEMRSWDHLPKSGRTRVKNDDLESLPWALIYPVGLTPAGGIAIDDNPEDNASLAEMAHQTKALIARLPQQDKQVAEKFIIERKTLTEISREMGLSPGRICQIRTEVVRKITSYQAYSKSHAPK